MEHTDKERLDWLEKQDGMGLISDDAGRWAVSTGGIQNVPNPKRATRISSVFLVEAKEWQGTVRKAIDYAIEHEEE